MSKILIAVFNITAENTTITFSAKNISATSINWGDGTTNSEVSHTYAAVGEYTCEITLSDNVTTIWNAIFTNNTYLVSVIIPDGITSLYNSAFNGCTALTSVTIPDSVTAIGSDVFYGCTALTAVTIPDSVTTLGTRTFNGCTALTSAVIGNSVTALGASAFNGCTALTSVIIGGSVASIGAGVFSTCRSLTSVTIPDSVNSIGERAFYNCEALTSVIIPNSVTTVGEKAFMYCYSLTSVIIGDSVTSIGDYAFAYCQLPSVTIPDSVTTIGEYAFYDCDYLTEVIIGDSVTTIGDYAFYKCISLTKIEYFNNTNPPTITNTTFQTGATICVPSNLFDEYKASWLAVAPDLTIVPIKYITLYGLKKYHELLKSKHLGDTNNGGDNNDGTSNYDLENTLNTLDFRFTPCNGIDSDGRPNTVGRNYIVTENILCLPYDIVLKVDASNFSKMSVFTYNGYDGGSHTDHGWVNVTSDYTVSAGTYFRILARPRGSVSQIVVPVENTELYQSIVIYRAGYEGFNLRDSYATMRRLGIASFAADALRFTALPKKVIGINHRGYTEIAPENTLPAFKLSKEHGFDYVEGDVQFTADGIPVMLHDTTINRTARNADGTALSNTINIADITYEQALEYDFCGDKTGYAGTKIPTFEEFLRLCRNLSLHPYIELKTAITSEQAQKLLDIVKKHSMLDCVTWISVTKDSLLHIVTLYKKARIGFLAGNPTETATLSVKALETGYNEVFLDANVNSANFTEDFINKCIDRNIPLEVYCPNTAEEILALHPYISGVTSDKLVASDVLMNDE